MNREVRHVDAGMAVGRDEPVGWIMTEEDNDEPD